jgi:hypothetical protein
MISLFESLTCFEQLCAHSQGDNCINTTSGTIILKISEWSKITKVTRIHRGCNAVQSEPPQWPATKNVCKTRGCNYSFELLMMGGVSPETC